MEAAITTPTNNGSSNKQPQQTMGAAKTINNNIIISPLERTAARAT